MALSTSLSAESRALRRSNAVFKKGASPDDLVPVLYSNFLLTPDEKAKATQPTLTDNQKLEKIFTTLERRVSVEPAALKTLIRALKDEPATDSVGNKMQGIYDEELAKQAATTGEQGAGQAVITQSDGAGQNGSDRGQRTPLQQELMDNVKETDWYRLGLELIDEHTVNVIDRDTALPRIQDKLRELFRVWLESDPTWRDIVEAERKIGNKRLARKLEEKFC